MMEDMQVRNLALNTHTSYVQQVSLFARHFNTPPEHLGPEDIRTYPNTKRASSVDRSGRAVRR